MVCANCSSKDVIRVQDQFFCVNCGNLVESDRKPDEPVTEDAVELSETALTLNEPGLAGAIVEPTRVTMPKPAATVAAIAAAPVALATPGPKRRPGRPKAGPLDAPKPDAAASTRDLSPRARQARDTAAYGPGAAGGQSKPSVPQEPTDDIPSRPRHDRSRTDEPAQRLATLDRPYAGVINASFRSHLRPAHYFLSIVPAGIIGLLAAGATYGVLSRPDLSALWTSETTALLAIEATAVALIYYLCRSLAQGALIYGAARQADHRPAPVSRWLEAAAVSQGRRLRYDVACGLLQLIATGLIGAIVYYGGQPLGLPVWLHVGLVFCAILATLYVWSGLALAHGFGRVAVTVAGVGTSRALGLGWGFFRRHFMLVGLRTVSLTLEALLVIPLIACVAAALVYLRSVDLLVVCGLVGLCAAVAGAGAGAGSAAWWYAAYRRLVRLDRLGQAGTLLGNGQLPKRASRALFDWVVLVLILAGLVAVLPLVPTF